MRAKNIVVLVAGMDVFSPIAHETNFHIDQCHCAMLRSTSAFSTIKVYFQFNNSQTNFNALQANVSLKQLKIEILNSIERMINHITGSRQIATSFPTIFPAHKWKRITRMR